jgi:hypothetical protein
MKVCPRCGVEKPLVAFSKCAKARDGLQTYCRDCAKAYYLANAETIKQQVRVVSLRRAAEIRAILMAYRSAHPCVDCGEADPVVLDFDHVRGRKEFEICHAARLKVSIERLMREIAKCEVRCANCHRKVTAKRRAGVR